MIDIITRTLVITGGIFVAVFYIGITIWYIAKKKNNKDNSAE